MTEQNVNSIRTHSVHSSIIDVPSAVNLASWITAPPKCVGNPRARLDDYKWHQDTVSSFGSELQHYSSFAVLPYSYTVLLSLEPKKPPVGATSSANIGPIISATTSSSNMSDQPARETRSPVLEKAASAPASYKAVAKVVPFRYVMLSTQLHISFFSPPFTSLYTKLPTVNEIYIEYDTMVIDPLDPTDEEKAALSEALALPLLAELLRIDWGSYRDEAPLVRIALLSHALSEDALKYDTEPYKLVRNLRPSPLKISIDNSTKKPVDFKLIAVPLDIFIQLESGNGQWPEFVSSSSWEIVPMNNIVARSAFVREYLMAYMSSELTFGTVCRHYNVTTEDQSGTLVTAATGTLAYVQGQKNIIIVLTNSNSHTAPPTLMIGDLKVPVYRGGNSNAENVENNLNPIDFADEWNAWYNNNNIINIRCNLANAWTYISSNLVADGVVGKALSLTAELITSMSPGMYVYPSKRELGYDVSRELIGAIAVSSNENDQSHPLASGSQYALSCFNLKTEAGAEAITSTMQGLNMATLSALHIPPSGLVPLAVVAPDYVPHTAVRTQEHSFPTYCISKCTGLKRLAIAVGLIENSDGGYCFNISHQLPCWLTLLATAMSANTSVFLTLNDIPTREWSGYNTGHNYSRRTGEIRDIKSMVTDGLVLDTEMEHLMKKWSGFDEQWFTDMYPGIDPFSSRAWYQHSPVPAHLTIQWGEKLGLIAPTEEAAYKTMPFIIKESGEISLLVENKKDVLYYLTSTDTDRDFPIMYDATPDCVKQRVLGSWIDQIHYQSLSATGSNGANASYTTTLTMTERNKAIVPFAAPERNLYILFTNKTRYNWHDRVPHCSSLKWPNSPPIMDVVLAAKKYFIRPELSALAAVMIENANMQK